MFRTALRTSARAAGALSASSKISAVCTTTHNPCGAPMVPQMTSIELSGRVARPDGRLEATLELRAGRAMLPGIPRLFRDTALTSPLRSRSNVPRPLSPTPSAVAMPPMPKPHLPKSPLFLSREFVVCKRRPALPRLAAFFPSGMGITLQNS